MRNDWKRAMRKPCGWDRKHGVRYRLASQLHKSTMTRSLPAVHPMAEIRSWRLGDGVGTHTLVGP